MADFAQAYEVMIANEGGYRLTDIKGDRGGQTYAGIARTRWPNWPGWHAVDRGTIPATELVREFYRGNFWNRVRGDEIVDQAVAQMLFDFAVNAGAVVAVKLAQVVVGTAADGVIGPKTLEALNRAAAEHFVPSYTLAKIARYRDIVMKDRTQAKFLLGWINRALKEAHV